jgi:hypothetical protein
VVAATAVSIAYHVMGYEPIATESHRPPSNNTIYLTQQIPIILFMPQTVLSLLLFVLGMLGTFCLGFSMRM